MSKVLGILEAAVLVALGFFVIWLVWAGPYWHYLNPRFSVLSALSGAVLVFLGCVRLFVFRHGHSPLRTAVMVGFIVLSVWSVSGNSLVDLADDSTFTNVSESSLVEPVVARDEFGGQEYVRMNVAEVLSLLQVGADKCPEYVAMRGMLLNGIDASGGSVVVLSRVVIVCCLADAVGGGLVLTGDVPVPEGQWVKIFARLQKGDSGQVSISLPGVVAAVVSPEYSLQVVHWEKCDVPAVPFVFEFREKEPFAY